MKTKGVNGKWKKEIEYKIIDVKRGEGRERNDKKGAKKRKNNENGK